MAQVARLTSTNWGLRRDLLSRFDGLSRVEADWQELHDDADALLAECVMI
jgi:hypothetical protein